MLKTQQLLRAPQYIWVAGVASWAGCCKQSWEDAQPWLQYLPWLSSCSPWNQQQKPQGCKQLHALGGTQQTIKCEQSQARQDRALNLPVKFWSAAVNLLNHWEEKPQPQANKKILQHSNKSPRKKGTVSLFTAFETKHWKKNVQFQ